VISKGIVYHIESSAARVTSEVPTPLLVVPTHVSVSLGDEVAYVTFPDGTGVILAVM
jgi:hypothetical protein